jgi:hypothetical protein
LIGDDRPEAVPAWNVFEREHRLRSRKGFGLLCINGLGQGVRIGAPQDLALKKTFIRMIRTESQFARDLCQGVGPYHGLPGKGKTYRRNVESGEGKLLFLDGPHSLFSFPLLMRAIHGLASIQTP